MEERDQRPLSEVELQMLDIHNQPSLFPEKFNLFDPKSKLDDGFNGLSPPSFRELGLFCRSSLESLHLEHAYSAINSENQRARKERKKSFEVLQKRKTSVDTITNNDVVDVSESEKSRQERKRSFVKQRSKSTSKKPHSNDTFKLLLAECESAYNSLVIDTSNKRKERKKSVFTRQDSRGEDFTRTIGENYKNLQKSNSVPAPNHRRFSTGMQYKRYPPCSSGDSLGSCHELDNYHSRTFSSGSNFKKNDISVILDENESNEHDEDKFDDDKTIKTIETPPLRRYSTGMKPRTRRGYSDFPVPENRHPFSSLYKMTSMNSRSYDVPFPDTLQEEIR